MKGNEARVVLFLHPVKKLQGGQVSEAKPKGKLPSLQSALLTVGTLLSFGILTYVLYRHANKQFVSLENSTTVHPFSTTTVEAGGMTVTPTPGFQDFKRDYLFLHGLITNAPFRSKNRSLCSPFSVLLRHGHIRKSPVGSCCCPLCFPHTLVGQDTSSLA